MTNAMTKRMNNKKGFTLIELLVVIAIISIIVAIAAPNFMGHTRAAEVAVMKADVKVLSNAALEYNVDNEINATGNAWPIKETAAEVTVNGAILTGAQIDMALIANSVKNTKNDVADYVLITEGEYKGEVFHKAGIKDKEGDLQYGIINPVQMNI